MDVLELVTVNLPSCPEHVRLRLRRKLTHEACAVEEILVEPDRHEVNNLKEADD